MINVLEFSTNSEYKFAWNYSTRTLFYIFENLTDCMILYKYKLSGGKFILRKFGINNPDKIIFNKLNGENLILFHLDIYEESTHKLRELLDYCLENNIDVYLPTIKKNNHRQQFMPPQHVCQIKDILKDYNVSKYDFTNISFSNNSEIEQSVINYAKPLIRDIKIRKLL